MTKAKRGRSQAEQGDVAPLILVSADVAPKGVEFKDASVSLSERYLDAIMGAGGLPMVLPTTESGRLIAEAVRRADGVMLTGGEDVGPQVYDPAMDPSLRAKAVVTPDGGRRDLREILLIEEVLRQRKPLLAICRGHQVVNVALGGTLFADLPTQVPGCLNHRQMEKRLEIVHDVQLTEDSLLAKIAGKPTLGVNSTHHQAVAKVAPLLRVVARSPDGIVEGMEVRAETARKLPFMLTVQFHPERLVDRYAEHRSIFRAFVCACAAGRSKHL